jgi:TonB family protein
MASLTAPLPEPQPSILGRPMVMLSLVLHVLGFVAAVGLPRVLSLGHTPATVYTVDLVTLPGLPPASPAPAAAAPAAQTPPAAATQKATPPPPPPVKKPPAKPIILPDKNVKKPPKPEPKTTKPEPKKPEVKKPEPEETKEEENNAAEESKTDEQKQPEHPAAAPPQTASQGTGAPKGTVGGAGSGTAGNGTGSGDEYEFYLGMLDKRIRSAWKRPVSTGRETRNAVVRLELSPTGRLLKLELATPSGFAPLDRSVIQAVHDAEPFPPFPLSLKMDRLPVQIEFELNPEDNGNNSGG